MVEVAFRMVTPPVEAIEKGVVVAPPAPSATTWKRLRLDKEEVAEMVRTEKGEVVPKPVRETPPA